jgi:serine/threonine protein kinase
VPKATQAVTLCVPAPHAPFPHADWMAPELIRGLDYNESADVFSFGIVMCELIGRTDADPDLMPRKADFSIDEVAFKRDFANDCPLPFLNLAFRCASFSPEKRPIFSDVESILHLQRLAFLAKKA